MKYTKEFVRECVFESFKEVLGPECALVITDNTHPEIHLGLDSFDGVDYACILSKKLNFLIPGKVNPFVDDSLKKMRLVKDIVNLVCELVEKPEDNK